MAGVVTDPDDRPGPLHCPFCGAAETERLLVEGRRVLIFACLFSPVVDPALPDAEIPRFLEEAYASEGNAYFRRQCDRLHYFMLKKMEPPALAPGP